MNKHTWKGIAAFTVLVLVISSIFAYAAIQSEVGINILDSGSIWNKGYGMSQYVETSTITNRNNIPVVGLVAQGKNNANNYIRPIESLTWGSNGISFTPSSNNIPIEGIMTSSAIVGFNDGDTLYQSASINRAGASLTIPGSSSRVRSLSTTSFPFGWDSDSTTGNWAVIRADATAQGLYLAGQSAASTNITTNTSTLVKGSAGTVNKIIVNTAGTASTVAMYNDTTTPCDTGYAFTLDTTSTTADAIKDINHTFSLGICALTAGTAAANISVLRR